MNRLLLLLALCSCAYTGVAQDDLPADTSQLAEKLNQFSAERRAAAEKEISAKQKQVVEVLKTHLDRETKKGNLKGALAIQALIKSLAPTEEGTTTKPLGEKVENSMAPKFLKEFLTKTWRKAPDRKAFDFAKGGSATSAPQALRDVFKWEIDGEEIYFFESSPEGELRHKWKIDFIQSGEFTMTKVGGEAAVDPNKEGTYYAD